MCVVVIKESYKEQLCDVDLIFIYFYFNKYLNKIA